MARLDISGLDGVLAELERLGDPERLNAAATKAVDAGRSAVANEMASAIAGVEHGPYATGSVSKSVKTTRAKTNQYGVFSVAKPTGRDKRGVRNGEKAAYLQYGTPNMAARPWAEKATRMAEGKAAPIVEETFLTEMGIGKEDGG